MLPMPICCWLYGVSMVLHPVHVAHAHLLLVVRGLHGACPAASRTCCPCPSAAGCTGSPWCCIPYMLPMPICCWLYGVSMVHALLHPVHVAHAHLLLVVRGLHGAV